MCLICLLIPLYFSTHLHRYLSIILPNVWTLPSESCLPFCLVQMYSYLCGQGGDVTEGKIQVSEGEAETVIKEVHRQGHLGENKTWKSFNRKYSTPQGRQKCREVVRTCPECQLGKDYKTQHNPKGHINSSGPWETVSIDIVGPLPVDGKSHRYIVTMMDVYSRYLIATPVKIHTASTVSRCLYESVVA